MKKTVVVLMVLLMVLSLASCRSDAQDEQMPVEETAETTVPSAPAEEDGAEESNCLEVDRGLFNVTITIPAEFLDEGKTQEDYDALVAENRYKSATLNDDGSLTYVMTRAQHEEMMSEVRANLEESLTEMCNNEDYPSFVAIDTNTDYTEFTVTTTSEELGLMEGISVLGFYLIGGMYNAFNGTPADNIHVVFVNEASGAVISESNSADLG